MFVQVRWLKLEQRLIEVDLAIRKALHHKHPDIAKSLDLLTGFVTLALIVQMQMENNTFATYELFLIIIVKNRCRIVIDLYFRAS